MFHALMFATALLLLSPSAHRAESASQSPPIAKMLVEFMQKHKLESLAVREGDTPDRFVAALLTPGQLLVVSARYAAPTYVREHLIKGEYRDAYVALATSGEPDDKLFIHDLGADGLQATRVKDGPFDTIYESVTNRTAFDGDWRRQKLSEADYLKRYQALDAKYAQLLTALVAEAKRTQNGK